jgi:hypothetical protein
MMRFLRWLAAIILSLILRIPFVLGMVAGFVGLCVVAFLEGFHVVYDGRVEG